MVQPVQGAAPRLRGLRGLRGLWAVSPTPPAVAQPPRVTLVSSPLPVGQSSLTLPSTPQPVFLSHGVPLNQAANPPVLPLGGSGWTCK